MTKISILIPYNRGITFLRDCLDSIQAQDFEDLEVILVSDGANEANTEDAGKLQELLAGFGDKLRTFAMPEKEGVAAARNRALLEASGDFVLFLDSDDFLGENYLKNIYRKASETTVVVGNVRESWYGRKTYLKERADEKSVNAEGHEKADDSSESLGRKDINRRDTAISSVLGMLIPRALIRERDLWFDESLRFYSELPFVTGLLSNLELRECKDAVYIKRIHNDSISFPSLSQMKDNSKPMEFARSYESVFHGERIDAVDRSRLYAYLADYVCEACIRGKGQDVKEWDDNTKKTFEKLLAEGRAELPSRFTKQEVVFLKKYASGNISGALRYAKKTVILSRRRKGLGGKQQRGRVLSKLFFSKLPIKTNYVLFESFLGKQYADSCRFIYEYLEKNYGKRFRYFWFVNDKSIRIPGRAKKVKLFSIRYFYLISRAKYWVNNMRQPEWFVKRPGTVFLETWHGTPLKKLVFDMDEIHSASPTYKMTFYHQSRAWDYLISDNRFSTEVFERAFKFPREKILEFGYPRNDGLYAPDKEENAARIKRSLRIPENRKVLLYAPTWRDDEFYEPGQYKFRLPFDLKEMKRRLGDEYVLLLRMHYFIADNMKIDDTEKDFAMDVSRYSDVGDLYLISDICITDYSSVFFDYANLRRPILFYVYDYEKYRDMLRGFYIDMEKDLPGPLIRSERALLDTIENIDATKAEYAERYAAFTDRFCSLDDGHAAERIVKKVFDL